MALRGVIFDLDGTLVDSGLDFDAIRRDMGLPPDRFILESLAEMPPGPEKDRSMAALRRHELEGAERATLMPGARAFLQELQRLGIEAGILTRNSREATERTLARLGLTFSAVITREDVPPKPDGAGLVEICRKWGTGPDEVIYIGDFLFDIEAGRHAGVRTVLYAPAERPDFADMADFTLSDFSEAFTLVAQLTDENPG